MARSSQCAPNKSASLQQSVIGVELVGRADQHRSAAANYHAQAPAVPRREPVPLAVTVATAKKITGLGSTTIWLLIKEGKLETATVGRRRLVLYRSIEKLILGSGTENGA